MKYERPCIMTVEVTEIDFLLSISEMGPGAGDIGAPDVENEVKSIWDEVNEQYNINKEEQNYEDWN